VQHAAKILGIQHLLDRKPKDLSGGQRQRVAIGRAIVRKPKVFLFDEPLSNLDASLRVTMRIELSRLHKELGTTMIYVTHDQVEAMTMGDRIAVFNKGRIEQLGAPMDLYAQPANEFVATFLGAPRINLIQRPDAGPTSAQAALWDQASLGAPASAHKVGVRPEHLQLTHEQDGVPSQIMLVEHLGDVSIVHLRVEGVDDLLTAKLSAHQAALAAGQRVGIRFDLERALAFSKEGQLLQRSAA
jgi:multiple sugar transport system ATP-binding protein